MALDLNVSPYYNDFDPNKQFEKVLFKPGVAVQARELTQLQSYLSNAIKNHAQFSLTEGTRVSGGEATILRKPYIKINDVDATSITVVDSTLSTYVGDTVTGSVTGITAKILSTATGNDGDAVNKKTLYLGYTGGNPTEAGSQASSIHFIANETLTVTSTNPSRNGKTFVVDNSTSTSNVSQNYYGYGLFFVISNGVFFLKSQFVTHLRQEIVLDKYNPITSCYVGLKVRESIVSSDDDTSLLDPASGTFNFNAPGADRYKVSTVIAKKTLIEAGDDEFIATDKIVDGEYYQARPADVEALSELGKILARRTSEESGDYVTKSFTIKVDEHLNTGENLGRFALDDSDRPGDPLKLAVAIGGGTAYVNGYRHSFGTSTVLDVNKSTATRITEGQTVNTAYGNYFVVDEFCGAWNLKDGDIITLHNSAKDAVTNTTYGTTAAPISSEVIGQARVKHIVYDTGTIGTAAAQYRIYLYDIRITKGELKDVRGVYYSNSTDSGFADVVLEGGNAVVKESAQNRLVFRAPYRSAKTLAAAGGGTYDTQYYYQEEFDITFAGDGTEVLGTTGSSQFPYSGGVTQTIIDANFILVATQDANVNGNAIKEGQVIPMTPSMLTSVSPTSMSIDLGTVGGSFTAKLFVNVVNVDASPVPKVITSGVYVKIDTSTNAGGRYGPWNLGIPDVFEIENIWLSGTDYVETGQDVKNKFKLDNGQKDNVYDHAKLSLNTDSGLDTQNKFMVVKLKCFEPNYSATDGTYFAVDSYPVDDTGLGGIYTYEIPIYRSKNTGIYDLRDCIDFRPYIAATANKLTPSLSAATVNPPLTGRIDSPVDGIQIPNPITNFSTDVEYYLRRIDKIIITDTGKFKVLEGTPSENPRSPVVEYGMSIAELSIPAYPSISPFLGKVLGRPDITVGKRLLQTRRYSMSDIAAIEKRINRLEYYTALSLMEREADSLNIVDASGNNRFKNGIFVNVFADHGLSAVSDPGFKCAINQLAKKVAPAYSENNVQLEYNSVTSSGVQKTGPLITLPYTNVVFSENRFSSKSRNCVGELLFDWIGEATVFPRSSNYVDTSQADDLVVVDDSLSKFANGLADSISSAQIVSSYETSFAGVQNEPLSQSFQVEGEAIDEFTSSGVFSATAEGTTSGTDQNRNFAVQADATGVVDITGEVTIDGDTSVSTKLTGDVITQTQTMTATTTTKLLTASAGPWQSTTMNLGANLINVDVGMYMKEETLFVRGRRMKPNTRIYPFFDGVPVSEDCAPVPVAVSDGQIAAGVPHNQLGMICGTLTNFGKGDPIITDSNGNFAATYQIKAGTFLTGERTLRFSDDVRDRKSFVTTACNTSFSSYGLTTVSRETVISTQVPKVSFGQTAGTTTSSSWTSVTGTEIANLELTNDITTNVETSVEVDANLDLQLHLELTGGFDPIAQTFKISSKTGVFVTQLKVFFRTKSETQGITCQLREVVNGYPSKSILPYGEAYLSPSEVVVTTEEENGFVNFVDESETPLTTTFTFEAPVYMKGGEEYCFVLLPAGNSPDYDIWVSELGENKINTDQRIFAEDTNTAGILFTSANNSTWNAHQAEDITYQLVRAEFDTSPGILQVENEKLDYLRCGSYTAGRPSAGEIVHGWNVTVQNTGTGYEAGDIITLNSAIDGNGKTLTGVKVLVTAPAVGSPGPVTDYEIYDPGSLATDWGNGVGTSPGTLSQSTVAASDLGLGISSGSGTGASFELTLNRGVVKETKPIGEEISVFIRDGFFINQTSGDIITPLRSSVKGTIFEVTDVFDREYNQLRTAISNIQLPETTIAYSFAPTKSSGVSSGGTTYEAIPQNARKNVSEVMSVRSYSNEQYLLTGTTKSFNTRAVMTSTDPKISPVIDSSRMTMLTHKNLINNDSTGEEGNQGNALSRFINKPVVLADGQEAQDVLVQVALKQPIGSEIKVYGKFLAAEDDADFIEDMPWIELQKDDDWSPTGKSLSETAFVDFGWKIPDTNKNGFGEYTYSIDRVTELTITNAGSGYTSAPTLIFDSGAASAFATLSGTTIGAVTLTGPGRDYTITPNVIVGTQYENATSYATGQQVANGANLYTVAIGGSTAGTGSGPTATSGSVVDGTVTFDYAGAAATVTATVNTVTFTDFKKFSTKLVFLSSNSSKIPEAKELRVIALQA